VEHKLLLMLGLLWKEAVRYSLTSKKIPLLPEKEETTGVIGLITLILQNKPIKGYN